MEVLIGFDQRERVFRDPIEEVKACRAADVAGAFARLEHALAAGHLVAGFVAYEAGRAFEPAFAGERAGDFPLLHFGIYRDVETRDWSTTPAQTAPVEARLGIEFEPYARNIARIREYIRQGDVYQITYSVRNEVRFSGDSLALYRRLLRRQPVPFPACILAGDYDLLSFSPELFFHKTGDEIVTQPMKGTWPRGENFAADWLNRRRLHFDPKNRAENVMIADLMRNDLGRVGDQVRVPRLFEVASYTTLHQMTSTVTARVPEKTPVYDLFRALFPSGSVTGAPKIRAMRIIDELEGGPRRIHTGAIGYMTPDREFYFNVAIRTLLLRGGGGEMGVGGGIVWDSTAEGEYEECRLKSAFLK